MRSTLCLIINFALLQQAFGNRERRKVTGVRGVSLLFKLNKTRIPFVFALIVNKRTTGTNEDSSL